MESVIFCQFYQLPESLATFQFRQFLHVGSRKFFFPEISTEICDLVYLVGLFSLELHFLRNRMTVNVVVGVRLQRCLPCVGLLPCHLPHQLC